MINKESILSVFTNDKLTLMQYLSTIEKGLEGGVLSSVEVVKKGNATLSFVFTFADGTTQETSEIVINQGESINGAYIENGHLKLTLTNEEVLDAGDIKPVNRFELTNEGHLIVHYDDETSQDLGALFNGNVTINGTITCNALGVNGNISAEDLNVTDIDANDIDANDVSASSVSANSIVENMTGYDLYKGSDPTGIVRQYVYASACKNGNKITFVVALNITRVSSGSSNEMLLGAFNCPNDVINNLYPTSVASESVLDMRYNKVIENDVTQPKELLCTAVKGTTSVACYARFINTLDLNKTYYLRYEVTFLLSDNMA